MCLRVMGLAAVVVAAAFPPVLHGQDLQLYKDQVVSLVSRSSKVRFYTDRNFVSLRDGLKTGYIRVDANSAQDAVFMLEAGYVYAFVGACDEDCRNIDFVVYAPDGTRITQDTRSDDEPSVYILATVSGAYRVRATIPLCNAPIGCYWAVQAYFK